MDGFRLNLIFLSKHMQIMMDPRAVTCETCVVCQTQTTDPFRPTYCDHTFCKNCALVEMKSGRQRCRICKEPLHFLVRVMDQFRRPFKICPMRDYVMLTRYLVACILMMVIVDTACLVTSGLTAGLVWPLLLLYLMVSIVIHTIAWVILLAYRAVMWIRYVVWVISHRLAWCQEKRPITTSNITTTKIIGVIYILLHL